VNNKTAAIIPARFASTRFPGKVLAELCGKPMIQWVYEKAASSVADEVLVATDNQEVRKVHILDLEKASGARISEMILSSVPNGVGMIPGNNRVYVSQEHPDGRITFIDVDTDDPITVTGFELNGQIK